MQGPYKTAICRNFAYASTIHHPPGREVMSPISSPPSGAEEFGRKSPPLETRAKRGYVTRKDKKEDLLFLSPCREEHDEAGGEISGQPNNRRLRQPSSLSSSSSDKGGRRGTGEGKGLQFLAFFASPFSKEVGRCLCASLSPFPHVLWGWFVELGQIGRRKGGKSVCRP